MKIVLRDEGEGEDQDERLILIYKSFFFKIIGSNVTAYIKVVTIVFLMPLANLLSDMLFSNKRSDSSTWERMR